MGLGQATGANSTPVILASDSVAIVGRKVSTATLVSATRTSSAIGPTTTGFAGASAIIFQLAATAVSGVAPNMVLMIEDSIDGVNWNVIATFTAVTAAATEIKRVAGPFCNSIRTRSVITGTTPSLTIVVLSQSEGAI